MLAVPPVSGLFARPLVFTALVLLAVSAKCADYQAMVLSDGPRAYYRLNDDTGRSPINRNSGSLGAAGNATNDLPTGVVHPFPGALAGDGNRSEFFDFSTRTEIPWNAALNPPNTQPFTVEAWFYPASDQTATGQSPINNRYAYPTSTPGRQGWVFFQRKPSADYVGGEQVGWNFRMYNGIGTSGRLDVTSLVPYELGKWTHVVVVYDPVEVTNATVTMYINGVAANTNIWTGGGSGTDPGYVANTNDHDPLEAVNGPAALSLGNYNNTAGSSLNPYFGAIDEFAFYTNKLSSAQILAHYQNATNAARSIPYQTLVQSDNPVEYLRLDEIAPGPDIAINMGDLRNGGVATNAPGVRHPAQSALAGRIDDGAFSGHWRHGGGTFADIAWNAANNPDASIPFTFEGWFRPTADQMNPGPSPVNNRLANGIANRTGWVIYQRDPNDTYKGPPAVPGESGVGWTFRMYTGSGSGGQDVLTGVPYNVGEWQHLVVTWEPQTDVGPAVNGGVAWQGNLTAYVDGLAVATNTAATYSANTDPTEDGRPPTDFAVGSYNLASGGGEEFEGDIDEVAFYNNYVLTPDQILAHYQAGTNSHPATNYETLVLTAPFTGPEREGPKTYLRFNDPAPYPTSNAGALGSLTDGNLVLTTNIAAGPQAPAYVGFEASNAALPLDGLKQWASLNNPTGLNISGQITLEAWIKPGATQGDPARIISHGPPTPTVYDLSAYPITISGSLLSSNEVFLRIEGGGANYAVGSSDGTNTYRASYPVPAGDLGGGNWVHLAGTYDGANWRLFRNGAPVATNAAAVGALPVDAGDWAIGSTGNGWADGFAGSIDELAIYDKALSPNRIAAHYSTAIFGSHPLGIALSGAQVTITWSVGTLQQSDNVTGTYADLPGVTSPYKPPAGPVSKFYRLRQ